MNETIITRLQAKEMAEKYLSSPLGSVNPVTGKVPPLTRFVHFTITQLFELMALNGIITGQQTVDEILKKGDEYGIKLYYAQHVDEADCPGNNPEYIGSNTVAIINTIHKDSFWYDITEPSAHLSGSIQPDASTSGIALDKGAKCPPECNPFKDNL